MRWSWVGWVALITLIGAVLRLTQVTESLWLDELHTSWVVSDGYALVANRAWAGNQSPLYFYLTWGLVQCFGQHEWVLRLPSVVSGVLLIPSVAWMAQRWWWARIGGLLAAVLVALDHNCVFYATEARPYGLVQLAALWHGWVFVEVLQRPTRPRRLMLVAGAAGLFYLHYTTFLFLLAELICAGVLVCGGVLRRTGRGRVAYRPAQLLTDVVLVSVLLIPAAPHVLQVALRRANWARLIGPWHSPALFAILIWWVGVPLVAVATGWAMRLRRSTVSETGLRTFWVVCWWSAPLLLAWLSTLTAIAPLWMLRYVVASLAGVVVFAAVCVAWYHSTIYRVLLSIVLVAATVDQGGMIQQWQHDGRWIADRHEDWASGMVWLNRQWIQHPLPAFLCPGLLEDRELIDRTTEALRDYCLFPVHGIYRLEIDDIEPLASSGTLRLTVEQQQKIRRHGGCWLILRTRPGYAKRRIQRVLNELDRIGMRSQVAEQHAFGDVLIVRFRR